MILEDLIDFDRLLRLLSGREGTGCIMRGKDCCLVARVILAWSFGARFGHAELEASKQMTDAS